MSHWTRYLPRHVLRSRLVAEGLRVDELFKEAYALQRQADVKRAQAFIVEDRLLREAVEAYGATVVDDAKAAMDEDQHQ